MDIILDTIAGVHMRTRLKDTHLPRCVYFRHGAYWLVKKGKWHRLSKNLDESIVMAKEAMGMCLPANHKDILDFTRKRVATARQNAITRAKRSKNRDPLPFELSRDDVEPMLDRQGWKCAVTSAPFSLGRFGQYNDRPFAPSIDRINSALGYTKDNCRIVCIATNFAMNRWGAEPLFVLAKHILLAKRDEFQNEVEKLF